MRFTKSQHLWLSWRSTIEDLPVEAEDEAYIARPKASLKDVKAGRTRKVKSADELLKVLDEETDD
ncbi:MAG: hypothetical protein MRJ65_10695 [Candidatus Brocadiaceae bacterium]|nr:hypothetical protein [Candidatus Brocadiaceae bacterium]